MSRRPWTIDEARALLASDDGDPIVAALAHVDRAFDPVPADADGRMQWKGAMDERLRRLAVKIAPGMSVDQAKEWRSVMTDALADLPAMIALTAAKRAIHKPMRFLNEVEGIVRDIADQVVAERKLARNRIELLRLPPAPILALPAQEDGAPLSFDEVRKMSPTMRALGVSTGAITQEQVDEVQAAEGSRAPVEAPTSDAASCVQPAMIETQSEPTVADYIAHGLTEVEAEEALAERRRMLARGNRESFASAAETALKGIAA